MSRLFLRFRTGLTYNPNFSERLRSKHAEFIYLFLLYWEEFVFGRAKMRVFSLKAET